jgi:integrase
VHFEADHGDELLSSWTRARAREWLSRMCGKLSSNPTHKNRTRPIAAGTVTNTLNLIRRAFQDAIDDGVIEGPNPFQSLRVRKSRHATTREKWTVLTLDEQQRAILVLGDLPERLLVQFAMGSGLRQSEQWSLRLADVHLDGPTPYVLVRFGGVLAKPSRLQPFAEKLDGAWFLPTKGGRPRKVPLFGIALAALRQWLVQLKKYAPKNPHRLVFPRADGAPRRKGRAFRAFSRISATAGRSVRWHDLRHTCASALVGGWWGPPWSLEEVRVFLGHASITQTERYAHFAPDRLNRVAERTLDFTEASGQGVSNGEECSDAPSRPAGHSAPDNCPRRVRRTDAGRSSVDPALLQGVQTMVDDRECEELENVEPAPESADDGRFSSEVEQRFRNPETGCETGETEPGAGQEAASGAGEAKPPPSFGESSRRAATTVQVGDGFPASLSAPNGRSAVLEQGARISSALIACHTERDALKLERDELHQRMAAREARIVALEAALSDRRDELTLARGALELRERESAAHRKIIAKQSAEIDRLRGESDEWRAAYARACASAVGRLSDPSFASSNGSDVSSVQQSQGCSDGGAASDRVAQNGVRVGGHRPERGAVFRGYDEKESRALDGFGQRRDVAHDGQGSSDARVALGGGGEARRRADAFLQRDAAAVANPSPVVSGIGARVLADPKDGGCKIRGVVIGIDPTPGNSHTVLVAWEGSMRTPRWCTPAELDGFTPPNPSPVSCAGGVARRLEDGVHLAGDRRIDPRAKEDQRGDSGHGEAGNLQGPFFGGGHFARVAGPGVRATTTDAAPKDEPTGGRAEGLFDREMQAIDRVGSRPISTAGDPRSPADGSGVASYSAAPLQGGAQTSDAGPPVAGCGEPECKGADCGTIVCGLPLRPDSIEAQAKRQTSEAGLFSRGQAPSPIRSSGEGSAPINLCPSDDPPVVQINVPAVAPLLRGDHVHQCPECYEKVPCAEVCSLEYGLFAEGETPCGSYAVCDGCEAKKRSETAKDPDVDERAPDMATAAAAVAERDALPFGERATRDELPDDDDDGGDVPGPYRAVAQAERARRRQESPRIEPAALETRHRRAVGLLSDAVKALHAAEAFLNEEVKR